MTGKISKATTRPSHPVTIKHWPTERWPQGMGMSAKDGCFWGIGFGLAMTVVVPLILSLLGCAAWVALTFLGASLGSLL